MLDNRLRNWCRTLARAIVFATCLLSFARPASAAPFATYVTGTPTNLPRQVTSGDTTIINGASVQFLAGYQPGDSLALAYGDPTITASWDPVNAVLTIRGAATTTTYQTAILPAVQFTTTSTALVRRQLQWNLGAGTFGALGTNYVFQWSSNATVGAQTAAAYCATQTYLGQVGYPAVAVAPAEQAAIDLAVTTSPGATLTQTCTPQTSGVACEFDLASVAASITFVGTAEFVYECSTVTSSDACNALDFCSFQSSCLVDTCIQQPDIQTCYNSKSGCEWDLSVGSCARNPCSVLGQTDCQTSDACSWIVTSSSAFCTWFTCNSYEDSTSCTLDSRCSWTSAGACESREALSCSPTSDYYVIVQNSVGENSAVEQALADLRKWAYELPLSGNSYGASGSIAAARITVMTTTGASGAVGYSTVANYMTSSIADIDTLFDYAISAPLTSTNPSFTSAFKAISKLTHSAPTSRNQVVIILGDSAPSSTAHGGSISTFGTGTTVINLVASQDPSTVVTSNFGAFASPSTNVFPIAPAEAHATMDRLCNFGQPLYSSWVPQDCGSIATSTACATDPYCEWSTSTSACVPTHCLLSNVLACTTDPSCTWSSGTCLETVCGGASPTCSASPSPNCAPAVTSTQTTCPAVCNWSGSTSTCGAGTCPLDSTECACLADPSGCVWTVNGGVGACRAAGSVGRNVSTFVPIAGITNAVSVAAGVRHACALLANGSVTCWGSDSAGQLGNGETLMSSGPVTVAGLTGGTAIATGTLHTCAVLSSGAVSCWGNGVFGQLGNGATSSASAPIPVTGITTAKMVAAGNAHSCALLANGTVECWGTNADGQLGDGYAEPSSATPVVVLGITTATWIAASGDTTCAVLASGAIDCWGHNANGQLGNGTMTDSDVEVPVSGITNAVSVSVGGSSACALLTDGTAYCWGNNASGQLGTNSTTSTPTPSAVYGYGG